MSANYFHSDLENPEKHSLGVHCGSGNHLKTFLNYCGSHGIPVIQASSKQDLPETLPTPVIDAPNLALPIIAFLKALPDFAATFGAVQDKLKVAIVESHQATKKTVPETAMRMAKAFWGESSGVTSIREPSLQVTLGVSPEHLQRHGYHWITISGLGVRIQLSTEVNDIQAYVEGTFWLGSRILERKASLTNRLYPSADFI